MGEGKEGKGTEGRIGMVSKGEIAPAKDWIGSFQRDGPSRIAGTACDGAVQELIARVDARLARLTEPMNDFVIDNTCKVYFSGSMIMMIENCIAKAEGIDALIEVLEKTGQLRELFLSQNRRRVLSRKPSRCKQSRTMFLMRMGHSSQVFSRDREVC